ncbi:putative major capsid protein [Mesorhizobium phage vB_MloP_Lo5R7ANS]|uniref:Putative major capsid protein n=1 Tax=Mesorhizobium phage vB_MloP_Lo5R7ANS TaxID=1527771 RepID=A0A076YM75_9CAUD|nr:major head protein [Mesorhizobium phage vB_MloP_Lo5R7ANS]AIK68520.1 putative major capsid protein [Mesorhizobium phage vB_MloP_Lo5R7ANS]
MANPGIVSNLGQANGAGALDTNFVKVATGEILTAFSRTVEYADKHMVRNISQGKSASFPVTGRTSGARYHTPGDQVLGTVAKFNERVITIDDLLLTDYFTANIYEAMNHFESRSEMTKQLGEELAQAYDRNVARTIVLAARGTAVVDGLPGGGSITNAALLTDSDQMAKAFFDAAVIFDDKYIPAGDRWGALKPVQYYALAQNTKVINRDWDGKGSYADGKVVKIADIPVFKSLNLPNGTTVATGPAKYQGVFTNTAGVIFHKGAAGTVKLLDVALESEYMVSRQGTLIVAKYAVGHDKLRPECAIELKIA